MPNWTQTSVMMMCGMCGAGTIWWSFSGPAQRLLTNSRVLAPISMEGREMLCLCLVHQRSLSLCAAASDSSRVPCHLLSSHLPALCAAPCFVCLVLLCTESVAANCVCFLSSPTSPNILLFLTPSPLLLLLCNLFFFLTFLLHLAAPVSVWTPLIPPYPTPVCWSLLCCGGPQKRSGQMVSDDFRALLISTGNSLVLLLAWSSLRVSAGPRLLTFIPFNLN